MSMHQMERQDMPEVRKSVKDAVYLARIRLAERLSQNTPKLSAIQLGLDQSSSHSSEGRNMRRRRRR